MKSLQTVWKVSGQSGNLPDGPESFQTDWKVSSWSGKFPDSLEIFATVWKVSGQYRKFPDCLESFQTVWKLSRQIFYCWQYCCNIHILHFCKKSFGTWRVCRDSDLRTFGTNMSQKQFTHFWRTYVAKTIFALRPESLAV